MRWNPLPLVSQLARFARQTFAERVFINLTFAIVVTCAGIVAMGFFAALSLLRRLLGLGLPLLLVLPSTGGNWLQKGGEQLMRIVSRIGLCLLLVGVGGCSMGAALAVGGLVGGTVGGATMGAVVARGVKSEKSAAAAPTGKPLPEDWQAADDAEQARRAAFDKVTADNLAAEAKRRAEYDAIVGKAVRP